jgi:hypothetical protein
VKLQERIRKLQLSEGTIRIVNLGLLAFILVPLAGTARLPAEFSTKTERLIVEIDGINYGAFEPVKDMKSKKDVSIVGVKSSFQKITLSRHFVTDQSLYKWADNAMRGQSQLKDVVLISENAEGAEIARHVLKNSQPVSAVVEASNPEVGGLHEKIEFAVQSIQEL